MKNPITMLCVEDRENHMADLKAMLDAELPRLPIKVDVLFAQNLADAFTLLPQADAVMTDVFFPAIPGDPEEGNGKFIVERCLAESKPVVWVTSTYHHGVKTNDLNDWGRDVGMEMFDCYNREMGQDGEAPHKPWKLALCGLLYTTIFMEKGWISVSDGRLVGPEKRSFDGVTKHMMRQLAENNDIDQYPVLKKLVETGFPG